MKQSGNSGGFVPPEGLSSDDVIRILTSVSRRIARNPKYIFYGHAEEDIVQQGIYEGIRCIARGKYESARGKGDTAADSLERFMSVHIRRRLSNFKRDNLRKNSAGAQRGIITPLSLGDFAVEGKAMEYEDGVMHGEIISNIKSALCKTPEMLTDFHRMMDGTQLPSQRRTRLRQRIQEILEELNYGVEEKEEEN